METKQYASGEPIKVKRDSYTAFNGQVCKFVNYTRIDEKGRQLAHVDTGPGDCGIVELPVETFDKVIAHRPS